MNTSPDPAMWIVLIVAALAYWTPTIIAVRRVHPQRHPIIWLNFLAGWTFIGWAVCLVWALSNYHRRDHAEGL